MKNKIGVGVITCNREHLFRDCIRSIPSCDLLVVVNDGEPYPSDAYPSSVDELIQHKTNTNVATSKNNALRYLITNHCEHIFLIEDDVEIINNDVFLRYIKAAEVTGLLHIMFGFHGFGNKDSYGKKMPSFVVKYEKGIKIALNYVPLGAFCYYHRNVIDAIGYMDERFPNWLEHNEHSYRAVKNGMLPGFRWWPDLANSDEYIWDLDQDHSLSVIRTDRDLLLRRREEAHKVFKELHSCEYNDIPIEPLGIIFERLDYIKKVYSGFNKLT